MEPFTIYLFSLAGLVFGGFAILLIRIQIDISKCDREIKAEKRKKENNKNEL